MNSPVRRIYANACIVEEEDRLISHSTDEYKHQRPAEYRISAVLLRKIEGNRKLTYLAEISVDRASATKGKRY